MKKIIYSILLSFVFLISFNQSKGQCLLAKAYPNASFWDSCSNNKGSLNAYVAFKIKTGCFKYEWTVNGNLVDSTYLLHYTITQNGTYDVCIKIKDTCNNCDTTICSKRTITCFSNGGSCNWSARNPYPYFWDSCNANAQSLNAYVTFKNYSSSCFKYEWTVNGNAVGSNYYVLNYKITQNGTYDVCVKIKDTCNNCDTSICSKRTITCFSNSSTCNWSAQSPYSYFWDSCTASVQSLNAYITFKNASNGGCFKYKWTVNGNVVDSTHYVLNYKITQNGTYDLCVKVIDTCNNCDTSFCSKRTITCFGSSSTCNWAARYPKTNYSDSCANNKASVNAYISFNSNLNKCFKYQWTLNGNNIGSNTYYINYSITQNGTYDLCVKVTDTCNNCDTTICSKRTFTCFSSSSTCNWSKSLPYTSFWDTCTNTAQSLNAYVTFKYPSKCFKYQWTVNGNAVGSNNYVLNYHITQNGTYDLCVKVLDTCNNCDTSFCSKRTITCFSSSSTCNWSKSLPYSSFWDTCTNTAQSLNAYVTFKYPSKCFKYQWTINGNAVGSNNYVLNYHITQNGTYDLCVKVIDTCNNCDTSFCSKRTITCFSSNSTCNWTTRYPYSSFWDSCKNNKASLNGYVSFNSNLTKCFKYQWTVNGNNVGTNSNVINYPVTQNGTYSLCLKVSDTCNNCDTTFCSSRVINCYSSTCNWASRYPNTSFWDSCKNNKASLNGYVSFNTKGCFKYQWSVNGNNIGGNSYYINYPVYNNGTYSLCCKVSDTCNNCDTTFCSSRVITCYSSSSTCNWKSLNPASYFGDSCNSKSATLTAYVSIKTKGCYKYQWTVNGNNVGTNSYYINYTVAQNGTYNLCLKITDTCNNCDTTFCSTRTITCISSGSTCNWASRYPNSIFRDSCKNTSVNLFGYISFNSNLYKCFKYQWTVNGNAAGTGSYISYTVNQNGTYNVCVKVTDTCNNCDTTICSTRTITCLGGCNWASKTPYTYMWDSCKSNLSFVNAYVSFKVKGCYKYQWTVNGNNAGNGYIMKYAIFNGGTYDICVKVTDTCNNCDTTICTKYKTKCYNGIENIELSEGINIYPNPTQGVIKLDWNKGNSSYVIYNISGQSVANGYLTNGTQTLDLSTYPTGLYILQVKAADANITKKIFLQKE